VANGYEYIEIITDKTLCHNFVIFALQLWPKKGLARFLKFRLRVYGDPMPILSRRQRLTNGHTQDANPFTDRADDHSQTTMYEAKSCRSHSLQAVLDNATQWRFLLQLYTTSRTCQACSLRLLGVDRYGCQARSDGLRIPGIRLAVG
jgi:hypothetical protein